MNDTTDLFVVPSVCRSLSFCNTALTCGFVRVCLPSVYAEYPETCTLVRRYLTLSRKVRHSQDSPYRLPVTGTGAAPQGAAPVTGYRIRELRTGARSVSTFEEIGV